MPYRRLPNTDLARLRALRIAYEKGKEIAPGRLAFSQPTMQHIQSHLPSFEKTLLECRLAFKKQVDKSKDYAKKLRKAKLYISHFIQVLNMAVIRGDLSITDLDYFGLNREQKKVPALQAEASVIRWGERLIQGENQRVAKRLTPIANPTIALVKVRYEEFMEAYQFQKTLQKNFRRSQTKLAEMRKISDRIITEVWNEVEETFRNLPEESRRKNARIYGVVYVFRKSEQNRAADKS